MTSRSEKIAFLQSYGWTVGARDPRINTDHAGAFMCVEPHEDSELPTRDGANGPWAIVGDDLEALIDEAHAFLSELVEPAHENTPEGVQLVIPGAEKRLPETAKQMELW